MASKKLMPANMSNMVSTAVKSTYTLHKIRAVSWILGARRSLVGPGISARKSCMPPIPSIGRIARERTMNPIPPSHCVKALQKSRLGPRTSTLSNIVAPVVVKPDMDSK